MVESPCFVLVVIVVVVFGDCTDDLHGDGLDCFDDGDPDFVVIRFLSHFVFPYIGCGKVFESRGPMHPVAPFCL